MFVIALTSEQHKILAVLLSNAPMPPGITVSGAMTMVQAIDALGRPIDLNNAGALAQLGLARLSEKHEPKKPKEPK